MRYLSLIAIAILLTACAGDDAVMAPDAADHAAQAQICAEAVAEHAGLPIAAMAPEWTGSSDTGTDIIAVHHGDTLHTCEIDAAGRVLELQHPRE